MAEAAIAILCAGLWLGAYATLRAARRWHERTLALIVQWRQERDDWEWGPEAEGADRG